jgi:hypothetical protein
MRRRSLTASNKLAESMGLEEYRRALGDSGLKIMATE